jgi:hypothetical protein
MRHDGPDFQIDKNARGAGAFGETSGVIEQDFVGAYVNKKWWQAREIGVERGRERIARVGVAEIIARGEGHASALEHGAAAVVGSNGIARRGEVGPRREKCGGCRERNASGAKREHERECKAAPGGLTSNDYVLGQISRVQKRTVISNGVFHGSGKTILRRETIVRGKHTEAVERKVNSDGTMSLRRAAEVSSAMQIKEHDIARSSAFEAFARNPAEMSGSNLDTRRNFVGIGAKDFARDAVIAHAF